MTNSTFIPFCLPTAPDNMTYYGTLGDYISGTLGTILAVVTVLLAYLAFRMSKKNDDRARVYSMLSEMMKSYDVIVSSLKAREFEGKDVFGAMLKEFHVIFAIVNKHCGATNTYLDIRSRIDIAFTTAYYGFTITGRKDLEKYPSGLI